MKIIENGLQTIESTGLSVYDQYKPYFFAENEKTLQRFIYKQTEENPELSFEGKGIKLLCRDDNKKVEQS